jgi:dolichyl-phosphate-mannose-protein mannosyltransferase
VLLERLYRFRLTIMLTSVGALAAALRFIGLSQPKDLVFDEVYYARGAYSLLHLGYEGRWGPPTSAFVTGDFSGLDTHADFVVHPPLGKWMIAVGMKLFGNGPFGWRFSGALIGTVTVILVALIARHLFHSVLWGGVAGLFLAIDGQHIVASRTALLDIFLTFFLVAAFGLLLLDRRRHQRILAKRAKRARERLGLGPDDPIPGLGPGGGIRWWRLAAIIALGLATGVKWSGLYAAFAFLVLSVVWDLVDRHAVGVRLFVLGSIVRSMLPAVMATVILLPAVYVGSWASWFVSDSSYMRHWAHIHPDEGVTWLPDSLRSFVEYHHDMWNFHTGLTSTNGVHHNYQAGAWGFIIQYRPTAYYWKTTVPVDEPPCGDHDCIVEVQGALKTNSAAIAGEHCGSDKCVSAITALGNPLLWWAGAVAFVWALGRLVIRRDLLAGAVIVGTLGGWLPWTLYPDRIMFTFYSVAFSPWVMLTLTWALWRIAKPPRLEGAWSRNGGLAVGGFIATALLVSGFFLPLWIGQWMPYDYWLSHMWLFNKWI